MRYAPSIPNRWLLSAGAIVLAGLVAGFPAVSAQEATFPEDALSAYRLYEVETPLEDWLDGPVQYIVLGYENEIWKDLQSDEARSSFIEWFWSRRDIDARDEDHPFRTEFYARVGHANQRFFGFPRGWRGDRGRVFITLGPPTGGMRRTNLQDYGRCSADSGEWWTYVTNSMAFGNTFGEFNVIFVERRVGTYEVCDPSMLGFGAWPVELQRALEITSEAAVVDPTTEFDAEYGVGESVEDLVTDAVSSVEGLEVPLDRWGDIGAGGIAVVPVELPLRKLLFEPGETTLTATLQVQATLIPTGGQAEIDWRGTWVIELDMDAASSIGGASLRSAVAVAAAPGGYSVRLRLLEPLSASAWVWDGAVEIAPEASAASPPFVGHTLVAMDSAGAVAVLAADMPVLRQGEELAVVSWVRGDAPDPAAVAVTLIDSAGAETPLGGAGVTAPQQPGTPVVVRGTVSGLTPGIYQVRLRLSPEYSPTYARVRVQ